MGRPGLLDRNGWTGGQYSLVRTLLGIGLLAFFAKGIVSLTAAPTAVMALLGVGVIAAALLVIGWADRIAALVMGCVLAVLFARNPTSAIGPLLLCWVLLVHALLPPAPYGSLAARGREDPRGAWRWPPALFAATWGVMAFAYAYAGITRLMSPSGGIASWAIGGLALAFAPLALLPRARPWLWLAMFVVHAATLDPGMLVFHLFAFDPAWIRGARAGSTDMVFFDGTCGLCHRSVRFLLAEDRTGTAFEFSPLGSQRFAAAFPDPSGLPDSVIVRTAAGETLVRSSGLLHALRRLGGLWRVLAAIAAIVPRQVRDGLYDFVARVRYGVFGRAKEACPLLPPDLRGRFVP